MAGPELSSYDAPCDARDIVVAANSLHFRPFLTLQLVITRMESAQGAVLTSEANCEMCRREMQAP